MHTTNWPGNMKDRRNVCSDMLAESSRIAVSVAIDCAMYIYIVIFGELSWDHRGN